MTDAQDGATDEPIPAPPGPPCLHLRFKGMYVYTDGASSEESADHDNTIFWCQKTLKDFGPDDGFVGRDDCRDTARPCYEPG